MISNKNTKLKLLELHFKSKSGHIGGNLSCIDTLWVLFQQHLNAEDQFILSKGHAAAALYTTLWSIGLLTDEDLSTFGQDNSILPGHPSGSQIPRLLFSTGSLGHGPSLAAGLALGNKLKSNGKHVYCLCSDGEWQEGSCWEALIFAAHHQLDNLTLLIDQNGLQGFGTTQEVVSYNDLTSRIAAFDVAVQRVNGHDLLAISTCLKQHTPNRPTVIILDTVKGKGLPLQNQLACHYLPMSEKDYELARVYISQESM